VAFSDHNLKNVRNKNGDGMANTTSAKKMVRKIATRTAVNRSRRSRMRTFIKKLEEALATGNAVVAKAAFLQAEPEIMKAAQNGIIHKNMASRKVSRLAAQVKRLAA
jgi:small subunit ribosomal protein S20